MLQKEKITKDRKQHFESILTRTLDELLSAKEENALGLTCFKGDVGDYTDLASLDTDSSLNVRFRERESRLAEKIASTLRKLENGTFGICEECGRPIPEKRLLARPIARLCIKCKEKEEMAEGINARWSA
jgi:DnaK suppressor protein